MGWFKRKQKSDDDQEQMLRQIAGGGAPIVVQPPPQNYPAQNYPAQNYPAQNYPAQGFAPPTVAGSFQVPPIVAAMDKLMPHVDLQALIAKSVQAIGDHADVLRARGLDPDQLQRSLQAQMGAMGQMGGAGSMFVVNAANTPAGALQPQAQDLVSRLQELSHLHETGSLSDEEFASAKTKLLSTG